MKLSKQTEAEIRQVYQSYWDAYLHGDFETFGSFLDDNIVIYGTAEGEIFYTKEDALKFYIATAEEMTGKADFRNRNINIQPVGDTIVIYEESQLYILIEGTWTLYGSARITGIFEKKGNEWKLVHQHGSFPDGRTEEGQQIASEKIKEENLQLREAVKRRTVELENKTSELEIESSLERVRTVAMGMRKPEDMLSVCEMISSQLLALGIHDIRNVQTAIVEGREDGHYMNYQYFPQYLARVIETVEIAKHPKVQAMIKQMQQSPDAFFSHSFTGMALADWKQYRKDDNQFPDPILEEASSVHFYFYSIGEGGLGLSTYTPLTEEKIGVFHKFRNVFALAYQRFRDIEHAEAQAREAQIELALERVRARTMAMQHSDELSDVVKLLYQEFDKLKLSNESTDIEIGLINEETGIAKVWAHLYLSDGTISTFSFPFAHFDELNHEFHQWKQTPIDKRNELFITTEFSGELWDKFVVLANQVPELSEMFRSLVEANITKWVTHNAYFSYGLLTLQGTEAYPAETLEIQKRFAKVFEQTYIRFLDLEKAEAHAREARIEASLERVRSVALGMRKATGLLDICEVLYTELENLGFSGLRNTMINILDDHKQSFLNYDYSPDVGRSITPVKYNAQAFIENQVKKLKASNDAFVEDVLEGLPLKELIALRISQGEADDPRLHAVDVLTYYFYSIGVGAIGISSFHSLTEEQRVLLRRFRNVFEFSYRRYMDIAQAEAQAREAQIEAGLERVRSRTMAMQSCDELAETAQVLLHELIKLGIAPNRLYIAIIENDNSDVHFYLTNEEGGKDCSVYTARIQDNISVRRMYEGWATKQPSISLYMEGEELAQYFKYLKDEVGVPFKNTNFPTRRVQKIAYFSQGYIGIASQEDQPEETLNLLERFAAVFNLTYTRFNDLKQAEKLAHQATLDLFRLKEEKARTELALTELKAAQAQLIQSEKMASLGELTAGIAHEIQNPLNFVNNFSDVNTELIEEMKEELQRGNNAEAISIANDIADNEQKINHHGKRADAIVKGMLMHSRLSSGVKEATDINGLAEEYLRLAYHGLRAKDKSFNATMKTDFDQSIGKIDLVPQDIGRVILNLITNAFYAVSTSAPKSPKGDLPYNPTVTVSTKLVKSPLGDLGAKRDKGDLEAKQVEISVSDNGPGIPAHILDKIFQPFFTTKPTGEGTGLGLSLSYDIIKAHGGELKVETTEGEGTTFTITLPN